MIFKDDKPLTKTSDGTAKFLMLFDQLFDSCNGMIRKKKNGKNLRTAIYAKSEHIKFWKETIPVLESISFVTKKGMRKHVITPRYLLKKKIRQTNLLSN